MLEHSVNYQNSSALVKKTEQLPELYRDDLLAILFAKNMKNYLSLAQFLAYSKKIRKFLVKKSGQKLRNFLNSTWVPM